MDGNNGKAAQAQGGEGAAPAGAAAGTMDSGDWRNQLRPGSRQRIANRIMVTLIRHLPVYSQGGVEKIKKIALRFEEKIYNVATSQQDYLRKISLKMLTLDIKSQNPMTNSLHPNTASIGQDAHGPEMTMEATSYETTSGPEESDEEQSAEEDDGDVSKEDAVEEVVVTKEQNYVVGHKENVWVGENEISCGLSSVLNLRSI